MARAVLRNFARILLGVLSVAAISNAARAGDERLEYKLITMGVDTKVSPASNIDGRILVSGKYFGVAFYKDGRIAVKDFVGEADLLKGIGIFRGYSTYTFQDGASLTLSYVAESKPTGFHGDYTVISGTGAYANATGSGVFDSVPTKWTDGATLFNATIDVHTP
jgi:hypothetical protein